MGTAAVLAERTSRLADENMSDSAEIRKIADDLIAKELAPRLKNARQTQSDCQITPQHIAAAAAALKLGVWDEKTVKRKLEKAFGG